MFKLFSLVYNIKQMMQNGKGNEREIKINFSRATKNFKSCLFIKLEKIW